MTYTLITPLKTRHVEPWAEYIQENKVFEKSHPAMEACVVRKAAECGWFDGDKPNVDEMLPKDLLELSTQVMNAYSAAMGFDTKNSRSRPQPTPTEKRRRRANCGLRFNVGHGAACQMRADCLTRNMA